MQSTEPEMVLDDPRITRAMRGWMLQNSLHHLEDGLHPIHALRFMNLGLITGGKPNSPPEQVVDILGNQNHPTRIPTPLGPLLFRHDEEDSKTVIEVVDLLLYPDVSVRQAAWHYFEQTVGESRWLTSRSSEALLQRRDDLHSSQQSEWQEAGIALVTAIRDDLLGHLAGLRQSLSAHYDLGISKYLVKVLFPPFESLAHIRPPLWSVNEQRQELSQRIQSLAQTPTLDAAFSIYIEECGYVPTCRAFSASELMRQWSMFHPQVAISWSDIWNSAESLGNPLARFHACEIALGNWPQFSMKDKDAILLAVSVLVADMMDSKTESEEAKVWQLRNALVTHCLRHIESLHPCIDGERAACLAYWLANKIACILGQNGKQAAYWLDNVIPQAQVENHVAWQTARTPIQPSPLRYATLYQHSVWLPSLTGRIIQRLRDSTDFVLPDKIRVLIAQALRAERVAGLIRSERSQLAAYAIEENGHLLDMSIEDDLTTSEDNANLMPVVEFRQELATPNRLLPRLRQVLDVTVAEQYLLTLSFRQVASVTSASDDAIAEWLSDANHIIDVFHRLPTEPLSALLEGLEEFQLRRLDTWGVRLPHLMAYAIERCDDVERTQEMAFVLCRLSLNCGISSPIQRIMATRWRSSLMELLQNWRGNMKRIARVTEPWVSSRVRAASAAISQLIGPQQDAISREVDNSIDDPTTQAVL